MVETGRSDLSGFHLFFRRLSKYFRQTFINIGVYLLFMDFYTRINRHSKRETS